MSAEPSLTDSPEYATLWALLQDIRRDRSNGRDLSKSADTLDALRAARDLQEAADELVSRVLADVAADVATGRSWITWEHVGGALRMTKQAASQKHKRWVAARAVSA